MMAGIRGKDTKPELLIRRALHRLGYRYRLHDRKLPGRPDLVFPRWNAVVLINGCFWHGHDCHLFRWPGTRREFWQEKIKGNIERDLHSEDALGDLGWRILIIWECAIKGKHRLPISEVIDSVVSFIEGSEKYLWVWGQPVDRFAEETSGFDAGARRRAFLRQAPCAQ